MSRYIKSKEMFFDAAASMPIDTAFRLAGHHSTSGYLRMLRLLRLERAAEMYAHFSDVPFSLPFRVVVSLLSRVVVLFPPGRYAFFNDFMDKQSSRLPGLGIVVNLLALTCSLMLFNHISCCLVRERPSISSCLSLCCHHCLPPPQNPCLFVSQQLYWVGHPRWDEPACELTDTCGWVTRKIASGVWIDPDNPSVDLNYEDGDPIAGTTTVMTKYVTAFYWSFTILTTVGFGVSPRAGCSHCVL